MDYRKYTHGFVMQRFKDGKCVEQHFTAGDVEYTDDEIGEPIDPPGDETYFPFFMEQPETDDANIG